MKRLCVATLMVAAMLLCVSVCMAGTKKDSWISVKVEDYNNKKSGIAATMMEKQLFIDVNGKTKLKVESDGIISEVIPESYKIISSTSGFTTISGLELVGYISAISYINWNGNCHCNYNGVCSCESEKKEWYIRANDNKKELYTYFEFKTKEDYADITFSFKDSKNVVIRVYSCGEVKTQKWETAVKNKE